MGTKGGLSAVIGYDATQGTLNGQLDVMRQQDSIHRKAGSVHGCALFLVYRDANLKIVHAKAAIVGRDDIKEDTFYMLNAEGEFLEAE